MRLNARLSETMGMPSIRILEVNIDRPLEELIDAFEERAGRRLLTPEDAPLESRS